MDRILILGKGSRQCAIAEKLSESSDVEKIFFCPGSPTVNKKIHSHFLDVEDFSRVAEFFHSERISYAVTDSCEMLQLGIVDYFNENNLPIFGPIKDASMLEASKKIGKEFMHRHGIPTPKYSSFSNYDKAYQFISKCSDSPLVIKADGLINGRGVSICKNRAEALKMLKKTMSSKWLKNSGKNILVEQHIEGPEISIHLLLDGNTYKILPYSQDYKTLLDGNIGPNTGGMGTYTPVDWLSDVTKDQIINEIIEPTIAGLKKDRIDYRGCLFPGVMLTRDGPKLLEYNTRFGSPEIQSYMMLLKSDLNELLKSVIHGTLHATDVEWHSGTALTVELVANSYPEHGSYGQEIAIDLSEIPKFENIYLGGVTKTDGGNINTFQSNGGKLLSLSALGKDITEARRKAYGLTDRITPHIATFRKDIGL